MLVSEESINSDSSSEISNPSKKNSAPFLPFSSVQLNFYGLVFSHTRKNAHIKFLTAFEVSNVLCLRAKKVSTLTHHQ
jgi:hypothetical protein